MFSIEKAKNNNNTQTLNEILCRSNPKSFDWSHRWLTRSCCSLKLHIRDCRSARLSVRASARFPASFIPVYLPQGTARSPLPLFGRGRHCGLSLAPHRYICTTYNPKAIKWNQVDSTSGPWAALRLRLTKHWPLDRRTLASFVQLLVSPSSCCLLSVRVIVIYVRSLL